MTTWVPSCSSATPSWRRRSLTIVRARRQGLGSEPCSVAEVSVGPAEREGFEPPDPCGSAAFKAAAISRTLPPLRGSEGYPWRLGARGTRCGTALGGGSTAIGATTQAGRARRKEGAVFGLTGSAGARPKVPQKPEPSGETTGIERILAGGAAQGKRPRKTGAPSGWTWGVPSPPVQTT